LQATPAGAFEMPNDCIFCKIAKHQIPVDPLYEDDEFIAFRDLNPQAPVHALLIPKQHFDTIMDVNDPGLLGRALLGVKETAKRLNLQDSGFRTIVNSREDGGQTVYHLHFHILGGRFMSWPPG
jgi:histidine triad (HIT) family protein